MCSLCRFKEMSDDEKYLLCEALSLLGQFDGLPNFEALEGLRLSLGVRTDKKIISFTKNPLEHKNLLGELFTAISNKQVISICYEAFGKITGEKEITLYPYLLKEYNRRWYLFASTINGEKLLCFSLDRIKKVMPLTSYKYVECKEDLDEFFDDIIGITKYADRKVDHIEFWASDSSKDYVRTKPIHDSQIQYKGDSDTVRRKQFPMLNGGTFFSIKCKENYELIRELSSFGSDLWVLSPEHIQDSVVERIEKMHDAYLRLRT